MYKRAESDGMAQYRVDGITSIPLSRKLAHWQASIVGPANSPYEGGIFYLYIYLPYKYVHRQIFKVDFFLIHYIFTVIHSTRRS